MTFETVFNIPYTPFKFRKTLKYNNLIDKKKYHKQLNYK